MATRGTSEEIVDVAISLENTSISGDKTIADNMLQDTRGRLRDQSSNQKLVDLWKELASRPEHKDESLVWRFESDGSGSQKVPTNDTGVDEMWNLSRLYCYRQALRLLLDDRKVAITKQGRVALIPAIAEPDDYIIVVAGAPVPLVVRPAKEDEHGRARYYVICDCYLYGVMHGGLNEALKAAGWLWMTLN